MEDRATDLLRELSEVDEELGCLCIVFTGVASSVSAILFSNDLFMLASISDENSEYSDDAEGFGVDEISDTIPLDNAESKLLFSEDGVLAGLER